MANGTLGKAVSVANNYVTVYTVPNGIQFATVDINLLNNDSVERFAKVAVTTSANPSLADLIENTMKLPASGGVGERTCLVLSPGEKIMVEADTSNVSIRVQGLEQA